MLLEQNNFNINNLYNLIINLIKNKNNLDDLKRNKKNNYKYDTYSLIEKEIKEYIKK